MKAVDFHRHITARKEATLLVSHQLVHHVDVRQAHLMLSQQQVLLLHAFLEK
jgi:hypothetical protein